MSKLHEKLVEEYAEHYKRVNWSIDLEEPSNLGEAARKLMFGGLLKRVPGGGRVLDLGCGTGVFLRWLAKSANVVPMGVDGSPTQVELAKQYLPDVQIECEDGLTYLRKHPDTFDGIFCFDVLEHIPGDDLLLQWAEAARDALMPGGFFCCRVPNSASLTGAYIRYIDLTHVRAFTRPSILQLLQAAGFADCAIIPIQAAHFSGRARLRIEALLHRIIYRITGHGMEYVFTANVQAVGFRKA